MKGLLTLLLLLSISVTYAAESQSSEPFITADYPDKAVAQGILGKVKAQFDVDDNGLITNIQLLSPDPSGMFDAKVRPVMKKWRYVKGKPSRGNIITIKFSPAGTMEEVPKPNQPGSIQSKGVPFR